MTTVDRLGDELSRAQNLGHVYAVVDAAHFEYLQDTLEQERFRFDPLYLDEIENVSIASGPHLVYVTGPKQIANLRKIIGDKPACVWWVWPEVAGADDAIHRHLRGLNMAEIPVIRFDNDEPVSPESGAFETVLFRHADPNTIAAIASVASPTERARLFADAIALVIDAPELEMVETLNREDESPETPRGMLRIAPTTYAQLEDYALRRHWNRATETLIVPSDREAPLFAQAIEWVRREDVRDGANIRYVFRMTALTDGEFLTAEPIVDLLRQAEGYSDMALSILQREQRYGDR